MWCHSGPRVRVKLEETVSSPVSITTDRIVSMTTYWMHCIYILSGSLQIFLPPIHSDWSERVSNEKQHNLIHYFLSTWSCHWPKPRCIIATITWWLHMYKIKEIPQRVIVHASSDSKETSLANLKANQLHHVPQSAAKGAPKLAIVS